jgi:hypothetical protein
VKINGAGFRSKFASLLCGWFSVVKNYGWFTTLRTLRVLGDTRGKDGGEQAPHRQRRLEQLFLFSASHLKIFSDFWPFGKEAEWQVTICGLLCCGRLAAHVLLGCGEQTRAQFYILGKSHEPRGGLPETLAASTSREQGQSFT